MGEKILYKLKQMNQIVFQSSNITLKGGEKLTQTNFWTEYLNERPLG